MIPSVPPYSSQTMACSAQLVQNACKLCSLVNVKRLHEQGLDINVLVGSVSLKELVQVENTYDIVYVSVVNRDPGESVVFHDYREYLLSAVPYVYAFHVHSAGHGLVGCNIQEVYGCLHEL